MHDFIYVTKATARPIKNELYQIIHQVQDIVRSEFTFQPKPVGSSSRNMITFDRKSNIGFDFDFDLAINDDDENYSPAEIRNIMKNAIDQVVPWYGYKHCEHSTRVLTIKKSIHIQAVFYIAVILLLYIIVAMVGSNIYDSTKRTMIILGNIKVSVLKI